MKTHHLLHFVAVMIGDCIAFKLGVHMTDLAFLSMMAVVAYEVK